MGDIWNPFDDNNPVYVKLAREMGARRWRVKTGALLTVTAIGLIAFSQRNNASKLSSKIFGGRVIQIGVIIRK